MKMYYLLLRQVTNRVSPNGVFFIPLKTVMQHSTRLCSFCNFYHGKVSKLMRQQIRTGTTTANLVDLPTMKKRVRQKKLYTEILEVTNGKTNNKTASIQKVKASNITMLVDHCDDLEKPKITNLAVTKTSGTNISEEDSTPPTIDHTLESGSSISTSSEDVDQCTDLCKNEDFQTFKNITAKKKQNKIKFPSTTCKDKEETNKNYTNYGKVKYVESLLAYMQVYLSCKMVNRANNTLMKYRQLMQYNLKNSTKSIELYNILLEAYAFNKDLTKVLDLYSMLKNDCIQPTAQTYVYLFDAIERSNTKINQLDLLQNLISEMKNNKISLDNIFNETHFKRDQYANVLKVIRLCDPNFKPSYTPNKLEYTCKLINKIPMRNNYCSPAEGLLSLDELKSYVKTQLQHERNIVIPIENINNYQKDIRITTEHHKKVSELENYWKKIASTAFERNLKCLKVKERRSHNSLMLLHPFLEVLDKEHYINAIVQEAKKVACGSETFSLSLTWLYSDLGKLIYNKYEIETKDRNGVLDKTIEIYKMYLEWYLYPESMKRSDNINNRTVWEYLETQLKSVGTSLNTTCYKWPKDAMVNVGKFLYNIVLHDLILKPDFFKGQEINNSIPAFYTLFRNKDNYLSEQIKPHPAVSKLYKEAQANTLTFNSVFVPSTIPPRPWTSMFEGGYLFTSTDFVRSTNGPDNMFEKLRSTPTEQLYPVFDSLNQLSAIPWKINSPILDIVTKIFQRGGSVELNIPQSISMLTPPSQLRKNATPEEKRKFSIESAKFQHKKFDTYSLWCDALYKLSLANHFRNKVFWLPHNLDFRGRVYPIPPHLNHLASDLSRSLLLFAKTKPLGPKGLDWLKLHVINLTNLKKGASIETRLEYANENLDNILDSAAKPLTGKMWWKNSEEPWQTLAGCMEIANALKSPNIEKYESGFPIHQDGSCNGLQHYAALGRDQIGAESVNLYPFGIPKDVYSTVANLIEDTRTTDASNNVKIAGLLDGFVKRKVIKQTVMTTVYGVTRYGAKFQIMKQLKDIGDFPEECVAPAAIYLTEKTFSTLRTMFKSAREIQDWFTSCARIISFACGESVEWITPLGFPIVQPYMKFLKKNLGNNNRIIIQKPDTLKQKNAFAPNFIHSLDSTHMMLTSIHSQEAGITFVSVHDCFWTHACTVDIMNKICREQFVALHTEPILNDLAKFFVDRYIPTDTNVRCNTKIGVKKIHHIFTSVPLQGTFDINSVLSSTYFFS